MWILSKCLVLENYDLHTISEVMLVTCSSFLAKILLHNGPLYFRACIKEQH